MLPVIYARFCDSSDSWCFPGLLSVAKDHRDGSPAGTAGHHTYSAYAGEAGRVGADRGRWKRPGSSTSTCCSRTRGTASPSWRTGRRSTRQPVGSWTATPAVRPKTSGDPRTGQHDPPAHHLANNHADDERLRQIVTGQTLPDAALAAWTGCQSAGSGAPPDRAEQPRHAC